MFEKVIEIGLLFDFYGKLLSEKQYTAIELYYLHDLSLSEIAEQLDISRQGVHDILKRAEEKLYSYEDKLKLIDRFEKNKNKAQIILKYIKLVKSKKDDDHIANVESYIDSIENIVLEILEINQEVK